MFGFFLIVVCLVFLSLSIYIYIVGIIILHLVSGTVTRTLIHSHENSVLRDPNAQTIDDNLIE